MRARQLTPPRLSGSSTDAPCLVRLSRLNASMLSYLYVHEPDGSAKVRLLELCLARRGHHAERPAMERHLMAVMTSYCAVQIVCYGRYAAPARP